MKTAPLSGLPNKSIFSKVKRFSIDLFVIDGFLCSLFLCSPLQCSLTKAYASWRVDLSSPMERPLKWWSDLGSLCIN